jgi:hypothetical protein
MKNIHVVPTDKPSIVYAKDDNYKLANSTIAMDWYISSAGYKPYIIYITSDEESRIDDWVLGGLGGIDIKKYGRYFADDWKKIVLTTDLDLIADGVQAIDDEFLEWFVKNPGCESVGVKKGFEDGTAWGYNFLDYKIIIPQEEPKQELEKELFELEQELDIPSSMRWHNSKPKQETLEEAALSFLPHSEVEHDTDFITGFEFGAKWQSKRMYSEEEVEKIISKLMNEVHSGDICYGDKIIDFKISPKKWFEQFKKK